jgi:hypothetical protein
MAPAPVPGPAAGDRRQPPWAVIGVVAVVAVIALIAFQQGRGGGSDGDGGGANRRGPGRGGGASFEAGRDLEGSGAKATGSGNGYDPDAEARTWNGSTLTLQDGGRFSWVPGDPDRIASNLLPVRGTYRVSGGTLSFEGQSQSTLDVGNTILHISGEIRSDGTATVHRDASSFTTANINDQQFDSQSQVSYDVEMTFS